MPWGRNPLRDTKHKGINPSLGSSGANGAKPGEVFNLPLLLLFSGICCWTLWERTLDTCTDCSTLPIHTHFHGKGSFWHETMASIIRYSLQKQHFLSCRTGAPVSAWSCRHRRLSQHRNLCTGCFCCSFHSEGFYLPPCKCAVLPPTLDKCIIFGKVD